MGRHAAERSASDSGRGSGRIPLHSDLFAPTPGTRAARTAEERQAATFEALIGPHREALREYVLRLTEGDQAETETVLKETLYRAAQDPARYPQRPSAVRPWLVLTARTVLRDGERSAPAGHDDRPPTAAAPSPSGTTVMRAMEELAVTHRDILVELFYRGVSLEDAARARGVEVETIKSRLYFAMRALRVVLDEK